MRDDQQAEADLAAWLLDQKAALWHRVDAMPSRTLEQRQARIHTNARGAAEIARRYARRRLKLLGGR